MARATLARCPHVHHPSQRLAHHWCSTDICWMYKKSWIWRYISLKLHSDPAGGFLTRDAVCTEWGWVFGLVCLLPFLWGVRIPLREITAPEDLAYVSFKSSPTSPGPSSTTVLTGSCLSSGPVTPVGHHTQLIGPMREFWQRRLVCWPIFPGNCLCGALASALETALEGLGPPGVLGYLTTHTGCCSSLVNRGADGGDGRALPRKTEALFPVSGRAGDGAQSSWSPQYKRPFEMVRMVVSKPQFLYLLGKLLEMLHLIPIEAESLGVGTAICVCFKSLLLLSFN